MPACAWARRGIMEPIIFGSKGGFVDQHAQPVLSLLVPIYNVERYLRQCLDSAAAQTLENIEIICINDGSTDSSPAIIREYMERDARFVMIDKANSGYGDSMNRGLDQARGEYVGILESDDFMAPDALEKLVHVARTHDAQIVKGNFDLYWSTPEERRELFEMFSPNRCGKVVRPAVDAFAFHQKPSIWSAIYRRDFLEDGNIRFLPTPGAAFQDASFTFKAFALADRAVWIHDSILSYRQDNEGSSVNASNKVFCVNDEYAEIERWLSYEYAERCGEEEAARLARICQAVKYDSYMWSYVRLAPQFRVMFLERMASEFKAALDDHAFELADLKPWKRANLESILKDPAAWARANERYATSGKFGRAMHYLKLGGPGLLLAYAKSRSDHE